MHQPEQAEITVYVDPDTAARAAYLSGALSRACHYHPTNCPPPPPS